MAVLPPGLAQAIGPGSRTDRCDDGEDQAIVSVIQEACSSHFSVSSILAGTHRRIWHGKRNREWNFPDTWFRIPCSVNHLLLQM
jgi:hypothetical protein